MAARGFTLVEVLVALAVLAVAALGCAHLIAVATRAMQVARLQGVTATAAASRMEELRHLAFAFDAAGARITDTSTDLSHEFPSSGGTGLTPGDGTLDHSVSGYVDYLDASGLWVGRGVQPPAEAVLVRRWAIDAPTGADLLVLQVLVRPLVSDGGNVHRGVGEARLLSARARVRP